VLLPDLASSDRLIDDLKVSNTAFTPNGDGVNDQLELSFVLLKADAIEPQVEILDMSGRTIAQLSGRANGPVRHFSWDGRHDSGQQVAPGVYLYRIDTNTDAGQTQQVRTISVAY
jgi:gliding motility-associated-like protein